MEYNCLRNITDEKIDELLKIPLAQRFLKCGFKKINMEEIRKRFCCDLINNKNRDSAKIVFDKNVDVIKEKYKVLEIWYDDNTGEWVAKYRGYKVKCILGLFKFIFGDDLIEYYREKYKVCQVLGFDIETYDKEIIPERCYENINIANRIGAKKIMVYCSVVDFVPLSDSIIVAYTQYTGQVWNNDYMFEIDMW